LTFTISKFPKSRYETQTWETADLVPSNMSKTYMTRGQVYAALGDRVRAEADFKKAQLLFRPPINLEQSLRLADIYYKRGAYAHAIAEFNNVLDVDPENIDALNNRGNAYSYSGRYTEAIRDFDQVIGLEPDFALAYHNRGIALAWRGKKEEAIRDFQRACDRGFQPACESIDIVKAGGK